MTRRSPAIPLLLLALALPLAASEPISLAAAWPRTEGTLAEIGAGVAVIFSPDLSVEGNCRFYAALGFACFESADWRTIIADIHRFNSAHPERPIRTLVLETHGTNGNGLKVQSGRKATDARSYISVAALEEHLAPAGVCDIIISACNSGRLLRPQIYRRLNRVPGDKLFLPATNGIIDASDTFDPERSGVTVITPAASQIETTLVGSLRELTAATRAALEAAATARGIELPRQFAISEMMIQMLLRDPLLELRTGAHVEELSGAYSSEEESERLFRLLVAYLDALSAASPTAGALLSTPVSASRANIAQ